MMANGTGSANQGEGNVSAAREFNAAQKRFVKSGKVAPAAQEAERALDDGAERKEMEKAEQTGRDHVAIDPAIHEKIRLRAYQIWQEEGSPQGRDSEHWERARREITGERS